MLYDNDVAFNVLTAPYLMLYDNDDNGRQRRHIHLCMDDAAFTFVWLLTFMNLRFTIIALSDNARVWLVGGSWLLAIRG